MYAIIDHSLVPVRKENSDRSEMVTQLLYGEQVEVLSVKHPWTKIRTVFDDYEGWIDSKQCRTLSLDDFKKLQTTASLLSLELVQVAACGAQRQSLVLGSVLPYYVAGNFKMAVDNWTIDGKVRNCSKEYAKKVIVENAMMYVNAPYLWGGRSPFGIDCSGLTQMAYKLAGVKLWRDARQQAAQGITLNLLQEAAPGDLAFFDNQDGNITHTGIILADGHIIHASGKVRIDKLDHQGIFNIDTQKYSHNLRIIKRVV